jgi:hypothetical protein
MESQNQKQAPSQQSQQDYIINLKSNLNDDDDKKTLSLEDFDQQSINNFIIKPVETTVSHSRMNSNFTSASTARSILR